MSCATDTKHIGNSGVLPKRNMSDTMAHPYRKIRKCFAIATGHMLKHLCLIALIRNINKL